MNAQKLYDLLLEADAQASDRDLESLAGLVAGVRAWEWLLPLLREDAPRLTRAIEALPTDDFNFERTVGYGKRDDYTGRLSRMAIMVRRNLGPDTIDVARTRHDPIVHTSTADDSVAQRLYDLITAMDRLDSDVHVGMLAYDLHFFGADVVDIAPLLQDAPRVQHRLSELLPDEFLARIADPDLTTDEEFDAGIGQLDARIEETCGMRRQVALLFRQLLRESGLEEGADLAVRRSEGRLPMQLSVERRGSRESFNYSCVYIWLIGQGSVRVDRLANWAEKEDTDLVNRTIQPSVNVTGTRAVGHLFVVVANSLEHARAVLTHRHERSLLADSWVRELVETYQPRHVVLLDEYERPRVVFTS